MDEQIRSFGVANKIAQVRTLPYIHIFFPFFSGLLWWCEGAV